MEEFIPAKDDSTSTSPKSQWNVPIWPESSFSVVQVKVCASGDCLAEKWKKKNYILENPHNPKCV